MVPSRDETSSTVRRGSDVGDWGRGGGGMLCCGMGTSKQAAESVHSKCGLLSSVLLIVQSQLSCQHVLPARLASLPPRTERWAAWRSA